jgi:Cu(I)/Ag(I) efflux system membrane fusion protein/cobalt-zinc-cadmium efflux system membrane fusion protein
MTRPTLRYAFIAVALGAAFVIGFAAVHLVHRRGPAATQARAGYYCPMHPTYTSDRPGDCPICNMRLVKREQPETGARRAAAGAQQRRDICYLHNCPMVHQGKPCPMLVVAKEGEQVTCPVCGTHVIQATRGMTVPKAKKVLYWTDPMIPGYKADKPGKSPMGMELVPVYEEEGATGAAPATMAEGGYAPILVSPQKQQLIGVKTTPVEVRRLTKTIRTVGRVIVDETRRVHVHPKVEGWIQEIYAKYEGDAVTKGQPLFSFSSPDFMVTQQEYLAALQARRDVPPNASEEIRATAQANVAAARQRLLWWDITEEQIRAIEQAGVPSQALVLTSPIDGVVLTKHVFPGEYMERGGDFYHLADLSTIWVDIDLYEYDLPFVALGQEAAVTASPGATGPLHGRVIYISPTVNTMTRTATARLEFPNPEGALRPGMYATAELTSVLGESPAVPTEAILDTGVRQILFVDKGQGIFEPREVTVGVKADGYVEVKRGVADGEAVVTSGNFLIDAESRLKAALEGFGAGEHQHGP